MNFKTKISKFIGDERNGEEIIEEKASNEYYSLRMNRCLIKRRCGINAFFDEINEKCVLIIF